ncbi:DUF3823 domain-containing protein [Pedobacter sp. B4-66]|uniref:DUF3823 domain-containing protein n=1 Tax=Pedobacter sp. B4-66 TaxID=2817280 RepID=UPI001BDA64DE|nr:DUF3823 domain-containing protein [Pedobacter sp. B4-66]
MKIRKIYLAVMIITTVLLASCELDNYDGPNAELSGSIIDIGTKELVQQDIIRGTTLKIIEHGYDPVSPQYLRATNNGTYADKMLFANTYTIQPDQRNFVQIPEQVIKITGKTVLDFLVVPYIRVKDLSIVKNGTKVKATFKLQQNVPNNVTKIGLYASSEPIVGEPIRTVATELDVNTVVDENQVFVLEIDLAANSSLLKPGKPYFFRVGALINLPEAKFNYAAAVKLDI